jgi:SAM-dependent methyltransferase
MKAGYSYRDSHKYSEKGAEYEAYYQERPWQRFLWLREQMVLLKILDKYFKGKDVHLLDFACGTGRITGLLEHRVKTSTGVDVSPSMLAVAREKLARTEIIEADVTADNVLRDRKFNLITAFRFFVNAEPVLKVSAIRALAGLLADDGCFVFNNHQNYGSPWIKVQCLWRRLKRSDGVFNVMTVGQMKKLVEGVGLEVVELYPVGFLNPPKIRVPERLRDAVEGIAGRCRLLSRFSESPIAVCKRRDR